MITVLKDRNFALKTRITELEASDHGNGPVETVRIERIFFFLEAFGTHHSSPILLLRLKPIVPKRRRNSQPKAPPP